MIVKYCILVHVSRIRAHLSVAVITYNMYSNLVYLSSNIIQDGKATKEVRWRIGMAGAVSATLGKVWDSSIVLLKLKSDLFRLLVVSVLLYNAKCWPMHKNNTDVVEGFIYHCLRRVARIE